MPDCLEKLDCFCYVCVKHSRRDYKVSFFNSKVEDTRIYKLYFKLEVFPDEPWVQKYIGQICYNSLMLWSKGERNSMNFGIPMRWLEPGEHDETTCYVCQKSDITSFLYKTVPSALLPVPHSDVLPAPALPVRSPSLFWEPGTRAETETIALSSKFNIYAAKIICSLL